MDDRIGRLIKELAERAPRATAVPPGLHARIRQKVAVAAMLLTSATIVIVVSIAVLAGGRGAPGEPPPPGTDGNIASLPEGSIAFLSSRGGDGFTISLVESDGGSIRPLHDLPGGHGLSWDPDGDRMVAGVGLSEGRGNLFLVGVDGTQELVLDPEGEAVQPQSPSWSPDGKTIVFTTSEGDIYRISVEGTGLQQLTSSGDACGDLEPEWSPDSTRVVFARDCGLNLGEGEIFVIRADGSPEMRITTGAHDTDPSWSPDGLTIAFSRTTFSGRDVADKEVFMTPVAGGDATQITDTEGDNFSPTWSPDGSALAYASNRDGDIEIYVALATGEAERRLTFHPGADIAPVWRPTR